MKGRKYLGDIDVDGRIILKWISKRTDSIQLAQDRVQ
jgi:hypothetical protein